ncbi:hypothetical protein F53441_11491 [Fusarium austroafricanum]|uniref:Uncharacterized protein n=1 Tax=Fusarium austroafricanum TaxID=2364996 RepID=A0A8H4K1Y0_9HYPO|nr:hypothetical protein F53441_11491 [Fusarium austroafricanum]
MVSLHQQPESQLGSRVLEAASIGATLWPIAFAAVLGTALRTVALYSCERGTTLGTLEILMGSLTMTSTLKLMVWVRLISFWSPLLIMAWALSPLGGQSVLRAVTLEAEVIQHDFPIVTYPSTEWKAGFDHLPVLVAPPYGLRTVFGAAFSSSATRLMHANGSSPNFSNTLKQVGGPDEARRITQQDAWGNVRIPFLHMLKGYDLDKPHVWVDVPNNTIPPYESLIGVPIRGIPSTRAGNATMMLQSSYISLSCKPFINGSAWLQSKKNLSNLGLAGPMARLGQINITKNNPSFFRAPRPADKSLRDDTNVPPIQFDFLVDKFLHYGQWDTTPFNVTAGKDRPLKQTLVFVADGSNNHKYNEDLNWNMTMCTLGTSYVDVMVSCSRPSNLGFLSCSADRLRHTKGQPIIANSTVFATSINTGLLALLPWMLPDPEGYQNNLVNLFLRDPTLARPLGEFYRFGKNVIPPSFENLSIPVFEARLATVLNTAIRASFEQSIIVGADGISPSSQIMVDNSTDRVVADPSVVEKRVVTPLADWSNSTGTWKEFSVQKYKVNWVWMTIYGISSLAMLIFTVGHIAVQCKIRSPDILNSVSTLTRDSPYVAVPDGGSTLGGIDRIRLLKNERVRIGDVQPHSGIGKIAFSNLGSTGLERERRYE